MTLSVCYGSTGVRDNVPKYGIVNWIIVKLSHIYNLYLNFWNGSHFPVMALCFVVLTYLYL